MKRYVSVWGAEGSSLRLPSLANVLAAVAYLLGAVWRTLDILVWHDPRKHIYSDMQLYLETAKNFMAGDAPYTPIQAIHTPGTSKIIATFYSVDPTLGSLIGFQLAIALVTPLAAGALAVAMFGWKAAPWAVAISSLYFPFVDYAGYLLSDAYLALCVPLCMGCYLWATSAKRWMRAALVGALAGVLLFLAFSFKAIGLPTLVGFALLHWCLSKRSSFRMRTVAFAAMLATAAPGIGAITVRCTSINRGRVCLGSNKMGGDFLLGHYGRIGGVRFTDFHTSSPSQGQHGYTEWKTVPHSFTDNEANIGLAWQWIRYHPEESLVLSLEHVADLLGATHPWPSFNTPRRALAQGFNYLFIVFLLLPTLVRLLDIWRSRGAAELLRSEQLLLFSPILTLAAMVFVATGEARYRIPFDSIFIVLTVDFFRNWRLRGLSELRQAGAA